jgi:hypothetical protein
MGDKGNFVLAKKSYSWVLTWDKTHVYLYLIIGESFDALTGLSFDVVNKASKYAKITKLRIKKTDLLVVNNNIC